MNVRSLIAAVGFLCGCDTSAGYRLVSAPDAPSNAPPLAQAPGPQIPYSPKLSWNGESAYVQSRLFAVAGANANDVFAVGEAGTVLRSNGLGTWWSVGPSGDGVVWKAAWFCAPGDVTLGGLAPSSDAVRSDIASPVLAHSSDDGASWSVWSLASSEYEIESPMQIWGSVCGDYYVAGAGPVLHTFDGGASFSMLTVGGTSLAGAGRDLYLGTGVTTSYGFSQPSQVLHLVDDQVVDTFGPGYVGLGGLWAAPGRALVVLSTPAVFYSPDAGAQWGGWSSRSVDSGDSDSAIRATWGARADDVFLVGDGGRIIQVTQLGDQWNVVHDGGADLTSVWGSGPGDVYAVGAGGAILHGTAGPLTYGIQ